MYTRYIYVNICVYLYIMYVYMCAYTTLLLPNAPLLLTKALLLLTNAPLLLTNAPLLLTTLMPGGQVNQRKLHDTLLQREGILQVRGRNRRARVPPGTKRPI